MSVEILHDNVLSFARHYTGPRYHAMLCDPPYELGFMGKAWDKSGIAFRSDTWWVLSSVLHPGAFVMAFSSARGWHRQAVAMEDAGLIIHPSLFGWAYSSGFPKATNVAVMLDKRDGALQDRGKKFSTAGVEAKYHRSGGTVAPYTADSAKSDLSAAWAGHRYGLQALKPALEPVIVAQMPYDSQAVDSIVKTGAGALWIDGTRIPADDAEALAANWDRVQSGKQGIASEGLGAIDLEAYKATARWPANLFLDKTAAEAIDRQSEGASKFFYAVEDRLETADPIFYGKKASRRERDEALGDREALPVKTMNERGPNVKGYRTSNQSPNGQKPAIARNPHPTLKPLALTEYLARMLLPPDIYAPRRLFVPFAGVGSECIGAMRAGWECVTGVELMNDAEHPYVDIARQRIDYYAQQETKLI